jgi:hypothetical protein
MWPPDPEDHHVDQAAAAVIKGSSTNQLTGPVRARGNEFRIYPRRMEVAKVCNREVWTS